MKKAVKNIFIGTVIIIAIITLARFAYAKYMTKIEGEASADIAHFSFTVTEKSSDSLTIDLANTRLPSDTTSVAGTTVAPGTKGVLAFDINANTSDVSLEYDIDIDITEVPQNLIFYSDSQMKNAIYHSGKVINIKGYFSSGTEDKKSTNLIYWHWPLETGLTQEEIDQNDETDSLSMGDLITIDIHVIGQQVKTNPIENQHTVTLNANGGVINGYGNSEIMTKTVMNEQYGELPETRKSGYTFNGWYTNETGGERISADTVVVGNVMCYAQWSANTYTLTINPNGGLYNSQTENIQLIRNNGTLLGLEAPTREGYTFAGWSLSGSGSMQRGMATADETSYVSVLLTKNVITDEYGSKYTNYSLNYENNSSYYVWPNIEFVPYNYIPDHEYRISIYARINAKSGFDWLVLRHAALYNDYDTLGVVMTNMNYSEDFVEYSLTRKFTGTTINHVNNDCDISPRVEITSCIDSGKTGILDIDIKNISIYDITAGQYVTDGAYGGYIYKFGSGNATLTAKWIKK